MERICKFRNSRRIKKMDMMEINLDSVLENINLLIEDMEDTINNTSKEIKDMNERKKQVNIEEPKKERFTSGHVEKTSNSNNSQSNESEMNLSIPIIHCDFAEDTTPRNEFINSMNNGSPSLKIKQPEQQHKENVHRAREAIELIKRLNTSRDDMAVSARRIKDHGVRLYNSAGSTPQESPITSPRNSLIGSPRNSCFVTSPRNNTVGNAKTSFTSKLNEKNKSQIIDRLHSMSPRLDNTTTEKYDVTITCPDDHVFKAGVFKSWTAFQLAWKIAHVKGMTEKLALNIQEYINDLHLYRTIEDHENIHQVITNWAPGSNNTLKISEELTKFDLFNEPANYLPFELLDTDFKTNGEVTRSRRSSLLRALTVSNTTPNMNGWTYVKDFDKKQWKRKYLRLKDSCIYICENETNKNVESCRVYNTSSCFLYNCQPEFYKAHGTPSQYCFCVIPKVVNDWHEIKCFCTDSQQLLTGWVSGFRLMKNGQQLYLNFREAMSKEDNLRRTNSARQSLLFRRSVIESSSCELTADPKAPIDFSGNNGRIISDPYEVERIQHEMSFEIPKTLKRRSGVFTPTSARNSMLEKKLWYHGKMDREQAIQKLKKHGLKEGLFLVRESNSTHSALVLTVVTKKCRVAHYQIFQSVSNTGVPLYGIENGPQFTSLDLLIDSYHSGAVDSADFSLRKACP